MNYLLSYLIYIKIINENIPQVEIITGYPHIKTGAETVARRISSSGTPLPPPDPLIDGTIMYIDHGGPQVLAIFQTNVNILS